jgi:hypothetical protein
LNLRPPGYEPGELTELLHPAAMCARYPPTGESANLPRVAGKRR